MSDNDSSFKGEQFQSLLRKYNIAHDMNIVGDHHALGIVDRFARTIKTVFTKIFLRNKKNNRVDYLDKVVDQYNSSPHSGIYDIKPDDADVDENVTLLAELNAKKQAKNSTVSDLSH